MDTPLPQHARSSTRIWSRLSSKLRIVQAQTEPSKTYLAPLLVLDNPEMITQLPLISQMVDNSGSKDQPFEKSRKRLSWPLLRSSPESSPPTTPITTEKKLNNDSFTKKLRSWKHTRLHIKSPSRRASITTLYSPDLADEDDTASESSSNLDTTLVDSPAEESPQFLSEICQMSLLKLHSAPRSMVQLLFIHMMLVKCNRHAKSSDSLSPSKFESKHTAEGQPADDNNWWLPEGKQNREYSRKFYAPQTTVTEVFIEKSKDLLPKVSELPRLGLEDLWTEASRRVEEHLAFVNSSEDEEDSLPLEMVRRRSLCAIAAAIEPIKPAVEPIESAVEPDMGKRLESLQSELLSIFNF